MPLDNSSNQHPLPGDLQQRVQNALNLLTDLELQETHLRKTVNTHTIKLNELYAEEKSVQAKIEFLKKEIPSLEESVQVSKNILNELDSRKILVNNEVEEAILSLQNINNELEAKKIEIANREEGIKDAEKDINDRLHALSLKEDAHKVKVGKLLEAIK